jgi:hypothetical protein
MVRIAGRPDSQANFVLRAMNGILDASTTSTRRSPQCFSVIAVAGVHDANFASVSAATRRAVSPSPTVAASVAPTMVPRKVPTVSTAFGAKYTVAPISAATRSGRVSPSDG